MDSLPPYLYSEVRKDTERIDSFPLIQPVMASSSHMRSEGHVDEDKVVIPVLAGTHPSHIYSHVHKNKRRVDSPPPAESSHPLYSEVHKETDSPPPIKLMTTSSAHLSGGGVDSLPTSSMPKDLPEPTQSRIYSEVDASTIPQVHDEDAPPIVYSEVHK